MLPISFEWGIKWLIPRSGRLPVLKSFGAAEANGPAILLAKITFDPKIICCPGKRFDFGPQVYYRKVKIREVPIAA
jgi:hypothetical protein